MNDADIDKAISGIANENKISAEDLYQRLGQEGMNIADYRREIKEQLTMQKLQQQEIVSRITVSPQEIDSYLSSKAWHSGSKMQYHIEDITVPMSETPSDEELSKAQQAAKFVKNELSSGKSLKQTATNATNKAFKLRTADLGWRQSQQIPTAFVDQVTHMQEKQVSNPIRTGNGLHILRLLSTRSDIGQTPNRKQVEQYLLRHKFEDAMQDWVSKLRNQAFITTPGNKHTNKYA